MRNASPVMGPSSTQGATRTAPPPHAAKLPPKSPQLPVTEDRPNTPSFPCPASESETTWTHVKRLAGSHPSITFDSTQLSDALEMGSEDREFRIILSRGRCDRELPHSLFRHDQPVAPAVLRGIERPVSCLDQRSVSRRSFGARATYCPAQIRCGAENSRDRCC